MDHDNPKYLDPADYLDTLIPLQFDSISRVDVEMYIFGLSYIETATLLFVSMGYKAHEISAILGYKRRESIYPILKHIRETCDESVF